MRGRLYIGFSDHGPESDQRHDLGRSPDLLFAASAREQAIGVRGGRMNTNTDRTSASSRGLARVRNRHSRFLQVAALLFAASGLPVARAQQAMEMHSNTSAPTNSGPIGNGPTTANQAVTLHLNTDNPTGNTFTTAGSALTATYALSDNQFTTDSTPSSALMYGANNSTTSVNPPGLPIYAALSTLGGPADSHFTSGNSASTGIAVTTNAGMSLVASARAPLLAGRPTGTSVYMGTLTITFSRAVNNPILHISGMGGYNRNTSTNQAIYYTQDYEVTTPGVTLSRLSGNTHFKVGAGSVTGTGGASVISYGSNAIWSSSTQPNTGCVTAPPELSILGQGPEAACGSVRVLGTNLTSITLRVNLRSNRTSTQWVTLNNSFQADGVLFAVSEDSPVITLTKALSGNRLANTDQFTMQIRNSGGTVVNATTASTTTGTGSAVTAGTGTTGVTSVGLGTSYTLTEVSSGTTNLANYASSISCTNNNVGSATVLPTGSGQSFTITPLSASDSINCTITNTPAGRITIRKDAVPDNAQDFGFTGSGSIGSFNLDDDADATLQNTQTFTVAPGAYTVTEAAVSGWNLTGLTCTDPTGNSTADIANRQASINVAAGETVSCTFVNALTSADVSITKTNTPASGASDLAADTVTSGGTTTYDIVVSNAGPAGANGAVVRDAPSAGLVCTAVTCTTTSGTAVCPTAPISVTDFQSSTGVAIPTLSANSSLTFKLTCTVQ